MDENFTSNNIENDKSTKNTQEIDYKNLVNRLREISSIITSLKNRYLDKF